MRHWFLDRLKGFGELEAIALNDEICQYDELLQLVDKWDSWLDCEHVRPGEIVTLEGEYSPRVCAGLLALLGRGTIIVPLTNIPATKRTEFLEIAEVERVITVDVAGNSCIVPTGRQATHQLYERLRAARRPGLVLFSSGTSGRSKASVLDFEKVLTRYGEPARPRRTLSFMSLDHIGGINTLLHTFSQGGAIITVPERSPDAVFAAIAAHRVDVLPTTPTFLNMVLISGAFQRHDTNRLSLITYGTEPMPLPTLQRLKAALPHVRFKQTYGLSELGIVPTKSKSDDTLWFKLGSNGFDYKITDGVLWLRSEMAMLGYLNSPAPFDDDGYFNTQDMVEVDGEYLRILGRRSELINVGGEKVYPNEVEAVVLQVPNVADVTVSGRPSPITGMVVKAVVRTVQPEDERTLAVRVREFCRARLEPYKVPVLIEVSDSQQHSERFKKIRSTS